MISWAFRMVPEVRAKHLFRCFIYNLRGHEFKISYVRHCVQVKLQGLTMRFETNPYHQLVTDRDYEFYHRLKPGDIVLDCGAFHGIFTVYAGKRVGDSGHVFAFEPSRESGEVLRRHVALNGLTNVTVVEKGLWSSEAELRFFPGKDLGSSFVTGKPSEASVTQPVARIDSILEGIHAQGDIFIKMNIEGSEVSALSGAARTIEQRAPAFAIRTNHVVDGAPTQRPVEAILSRHGYRFETKLLSELTTFGWKPRSL